MDVPSTVRLKNDFMFGQVMRNPEICKLFLEELLGMKIDRIEYIENQKEISDSYAHHGKFSYRHWCGYNPDIP